MKVDIAKLKKEMGTTTDFREAGYILSDGVMLDFTGRHHATGYKNSKPLAGQTDYLAKQRSEDHREVREYLTDISPEQKKQIEDSNYNIIKLFCEETGAIRFDMQSSMNSMQFEIFVKPTEIQISKLRQAQKMNDAEMYVDINYNNFHGEVKNFAELARLL